MGELSISGNVEVLIVALGSCSFWMLLLASYYELSLQKVILDCHCLIKILGNRDVLCAFYISTDSGRKKV